MDKVSELFPIVWMDLEMTGLDPDSDHILEIATIITDPFLKILAEGPNLVLHQSPEIFARMDSWNQKQHTVSGLWEQVQESTIHKGQAEKETLEFLRRHLPQEKQIPLAGNSIWQDRRFLAKHMPELESFFHYRIIDVSSIKELCHRWFPTLKFAKQEDDTHRALHDARQSIEELRFYRQEIFHLPDLSCNHS